MLLGCSNDECLQACYQCTSWVVRSWQTFVTSAFVIHRATHLFASPVYYCYGSYSRISIAMLLPVCSNDERLKAWYKCISWVVRSWQTLLQVCTSYTVRPAHSALYIWWCHIAIEHQWRCFCPAVRTMNASKHGADKNLFQVRSSYTELHTFLPLQYSSSIEATGWCQAVQTMNASEHGTNAVHGPEKKIVPSPYVVHSQTCTLFPVYLMMSSSKWISMVMLLPGCWNDECLQACYQCASWVMRSWQNFVPSTFIVNCKNYTPFCLSSILVLRQL